VPLQFLTETGLVGALLALGGLALLGWVAVRNVLARPAGAERGFAAALLAGAFAWSLHLWVDWDWDIPGVTVPVLILLGVLVARPRSQVAVAAERRRMASRGLVLAAGGIAAFVAAVLVALPAVADSLTSSALSASSTGRAADLRSGERKAALAKRLNPFAVEPLFAQASIAQRGNRPRKAAQLLVDAVDRQPDNPQTWSRLLVIQGLLDDSGGLLRSINVLLALDPVGTVRGGVRSQYTFYDPARSASATGTPLPEKLATPKPAPRRPAPQTGTGTPAPSTGTGNGTSRTPTQTTPTPATPTPTPTPAPTPTPTPAPKSTPKATPKTPSGDPFRHEG
jgi:hypothetical protein